MSSAASLFGWWHRGDRTAKRALVAASLGWMLDSFDVMLYALVLTSVRKDLGLDESAAGFLQSLTLIASAVGGICFGVIADRLGRTRALMASVLFYSIFTALCGFAATALQLAVFRVFLGFGMGGEWASGAALVSETWSDRDRGKAMGFVQGSWAIGYALAAVISWLVQDVAGLGWRAVFFVGVAPALYALWIRWRVEEPELWHKSRAKPAPVPLATLLRGTMLRVTLALTIMNGFTMFAWWGLNTWVPSFLRAQGNGGIGLTNTAMTAFLVAMQIGMWFGYVTFGFVSDRFGRRRAYVAYLLAATVFMLAYAWSGTPWLLFALGPVVAFFGTGYFSGFGAVTAEIFPTEIRATAQGLTYNAGRIASAAAPWLVGGLVKTKGYPTALSLTAVALLLAAAAWIFIPETKGRVLDQIA
jgi:MFS family permease